MYEDFRLVEAEWAVSTMFNWWLSFFIAIDKLGPYSVTDYNETIFLALQFIFSAPLFFSGMLEASVHWEGRPVATRAHYTERRGGPATRIHKLGVTRNHMKFY